MDRREAVKSLLVFAGLPLSASIMVHDANKKALTNNWDSVLMVSIKVSDYTPEDELAQICEDAKREIKALAGRDIPVVVAPGMEFTVHTV